MITARASPTCSAHGSAASGAGRARRVISVVASGREPADVRQRKGLYPVHAGSSNLPGLEVAGTIEAASRSARGQRACASATASCAGSGWGLAEYCVAPVGQCCRHRRLSDTRPRAAGDLLHGLSNVFDRARLQPGETLRVQWRQQRHRRDRDPAGQGRGARSSSPSDRREGGSVPVARRRARHHYKTQDFGARPCADPRQGR